MHLAQRVTAARWWDEGLHKKVKLLGVG